MLPFDAEQQFFVASDGLRLSAYTGGAEDGPQILFLHGFSQAALCWQRQFSDPDLAQSCSLAAVDLRGHGASDKPIDAEYYQSDRQFADDLAMALEVLGLTRPVIVAWSYAARIVSDYVMVYGERNIGGINFVGARTNNNPEYNGPGRDNVDGMLSRDLGVNVAATRSFLRACFFKPPSPTSFQETLAYNMVVPPEVRAAHLSRPANDGRFLDQLTVPVLVTQGDKDALVLPGLGQETASRVANARLSMYEGTGHVPFVEDAERFNRELLEFVTLCQGAAAA